jgi:hypothetical protein
MAGPMVTPHELRRIADEQEMAKAREALEKKRKMEQEHDHLRDAFMSQQIHPEVFERVSRVVRGAAERGEREVLALRFSSEYCTDGGRAINSFEPDWPEPHRLRQARLRVRAERARAARLPAARPDCGFPGRHAWRRRDLSPMVSGIR